MLFFYQPELSEGNHILSGDEFHHCVKVLRKSTGDVIGVYDGKGAVLECAIKEISSRQVALEVLSSERIAPKPFRNHIAIAPTKNLDRLEWFVEKACELAVDEISFILTKNTERKKLRIDRLEKKAVSALKQSKSGYITKINEMISIESFLREAKFDQGFIAVVEKDLPYFSNDINRRKDILTLIGPEGDFRKEEVTLAEQYNLRKISLGNTTLRTETAGLMASHFVNVINEY